jgi:GT2 family glycosyltransferase
MVAGRVPRVGVVIVAFNSARHLPALIASLPGAAPGVDLEVVVVDNASTDHTVAVCEANGVRCIATGVNGGYSRAINVGARHLRGVDAHMVCNPDLVLGPASITALWEAVAVSRGVAVPRLEDDAGALLRSLRREPTVLGQLGEAALGDHWAGRPAVLTEIVREPTRYATAHEVDWATGAAVMIHRDCLAAVGPWDEDFFLFSEEVDYMTRARRAGFRVTYTPAATARHSEGGSGRPPGFVSLVATNRLRYFRGGHGATSIGCYGLMVLLELALRMRRPGHRQALPVVARSIWPAMARGLPPAQAPAPAATAAFGP